jgi:2-oxo-4-hydroxy-4-carboxy-5-ureidoimidazoline decarboxylase
MQAVNELTRDEFVNRFGKVYEDSAWVAEGAYELRPFESPAALHDAMGRIVIRAGSGRQLELIRAHPDLAGKLAIAGELTENSAEEQKSAGLDRLTAEEFARFDAANLNYREHFGFPFIICVRDHSRQEILAAFHERLRHSQDEEIERALHEIQRIAWHRLEGILEKLR